MRFWKAGLAALAFSVGVRAGVAADLAAISNDLTVLGTDVAAFAATPSVGTAVTVVTDLTTLTLDMVTLTADLGSDPQGVTLLVGFIIQHCDLYKQLLQTIFNTLRGLPVILRTALLAMFAASLQNLANVLLHWIDIFKKLPPGTPGIKEAIECLTEVVNTIFNILNSMKIKTVRSIGGPHAARIPIPAF